jgi:microcin C transport system substrate-binding protein
MRRLASSQASDRRLRTWTCAAFVLLLQTAIACAADGAERHGISAFGDLKYPPDFKHFEYVNPDAPKGGRIAQLGSGATLTFDSFNAFILKGDAAQGLPLLFDSLMVRAYDEPDAVYGLIARSVVRAPDGLSITFHMRPEAKFADGTPVTANDPVFTLKTLKEKGHPQYRLALRDVVDVIADGPLTVRYVFKGKQTRDLPQIVATLPVLSAAFYATRTFDMTTLEPPLGSGPYAIGDFKQGTFVTYKRRPDYWAKDLPVNRGQHNFDEVRYEYFRDRTASLESLKAGAYDLREEFTAKDWSTAYDVPQVKDGRLVRATLRDESPSGAQGFFINTRKSKFSDPRVRKALNFAFDYEWTNRNLFYNLYIRTNSYFENSPLKAEGRPSKEELALLEPYRDQLPQEVFEDPFLAPVTQGSWGDRANLREAQRLLHEAGWSLDNQDPADKTCGVVCRAVRVTFAEPRPPSVRNEKGETLDVEFLTNEPSFERIIAPFVRNLRAIGIRASIRRVDSAQYERRVKGLDFDIITTRFSMRLTPGVELKDFFSSESARMDGTRNLAGIASPVVDAMVDKVLEANTREELVTATHALDRVLRSGHYWIPHWYKASHTLAYWNKFSRPSVKPKYARGLPETWWYDTEKAAKLAAR